jgi:DNA-binding MarR family transcriptional regulator
MERNLDATCRSRPGVGDPVRNQLLTLFWMLGPAFARWAESQLEKDGFTPKRMYLMGILFEHGPMVMSSLRDRLGVTSTNVTALVDALEKDGMLRRRHHPTDRRATIVELTSKAEEFLMVNCSAFKDHVSEIFTIFSTEEQDQFLGFLRRMRSVLVERKILDEKSRTLDEDAPPGS